MNTDGYITVEGFSEAEFTEKKSRFIGYITRAETDEEAVGFINEIKARHRKATHNVYAYIVRNGNLMRYSDDGEPQGTAGTPVLEVLRKEGLTDVCCVVTRYFGGILLGGGGLVRAYSHGAKIAVDASRKRIMCACFPMQIKMNYGVYGRVSAVLPEYEVKITDTVFEADVTVRLLCRSGKEEELSAALTDISNGDIDIQKGQESFENFA